MRSRHRSGARSSAPPSSSCVQVMNSTFQMYPQDSETFVRIELSGIQDHGCSCFGGRSNPGVEFLTGRWSVYLKNHIPHPVFEAMMQDIYSGPEFTRFLRIQHFFATSIMGVMLCMCCLICLIPSFLTSNNHMKAEVRQKLSAWNKVLIQHNCGVTMQISGQALVFNILPGESLIKNDDSTKVVEGLSQQLLLDLGLKHISPTNKYL